MTEKFTSVVHSLDRNAVTPEQWESLISQIRTRHAEEVKRLQATIQSMDETIKKDREAFMADRFRFVKEISDLQKLYIASDSENNSRRSAVVNKKRGAKKAVR